MARNATRPIFAKIALRPVEGKLNTVDLFLKDLNMDFSFSNITLPARMAVSRSRAFFIPVNGSTKKPNHKGIKKYFRKKFLYIMATKAILLNPYPMSTSIPPKKHTLAWPPNY